MDLSDGIVSPLLSDRGSVILETLNGFFTVAVSIYYRFSTCDFRFSLEKLLLICVLYLFIGFDIYSEENGFTRRSSVQACGLPVKTRQWIINVRLGRRSLARSGPPEGLFLPAGRTSFRSG